jgi:hypothetical protein
MMVMAEMDDPRSALLFDEGLRQIIDTSTDLQSIRTRASGLVAAIGVGTAFLGANALDPRTALSGAGWMALVFFVAAMLIGIGLVALPVSGWVSGFDPSTVASWVNPGGVGVDSIRLELAEQLAEGARNNRQRLAVRQFLLGAQAVLFLGELVAWIVDLA